MDLADAWHDLVVGGRCVGCRRPGRLLCHDCRADLPDTARPSPPSPAPTGIAPVFAAGPYDDTLKQLVIGLKEHHLLGLGQPLAGLLALAVLEAMATTGAGPTVLVWTTWQDAGNVAAALEDRCAGWAEVKRLPFTTLGADVPEL